MNKALVSYRSVMAVAMGLLLDGLICEDEYNQIDRKMAEKYALDSSTLCLQNPLLFGRDRANMSPTNKKGGDMHGAED
ncbi:MAG: SHOCT domain-containing protein [Hominisplanchenecus sp.]